MPLDSTGSLVDSRSLRASLGVDDSVLEDVRAVGVVLDGRVPELVDDFYEWLSGLPEYGQFFADRSTLAHVKRAQTEYWKDFLAAEVDDDYVERRRVVGQVHARIELGLLIYLRAMEFVSAWLIREGAGSAKSGERAAFSIKKLIQFDSAIVVYTYAERTAQNIAGQRERLARVARVMNAVSEGDLRHRLEVEGSGDVLDRSVNEMVRSLELVADQMGRIARGDLSTTVAPRSERDVLGKALVAMTSALREAASQNERHLWMSTCEAALGQAMSGNPSARELSERVLANLCRALGAHVGAQYVLDDGGGELRLTGTYAAAPGDGVPERVRLGDGLVGQVARDRQRIVVDDVPEDAVRIRFGHGEVLPKSLAIIPLVHGGDLTGVIEIGAFKKLSRAELDLLDRASSTVGLAVRAAETRARVQELLEESQAQAEELTAQQEELRQVNDMLAEQARTLELQKESLVATEAVLRQKAAEVERASHYKSEFLANMSHELRTPLNSALILAKLLAENRGGNLTEEQVTYAESIYGAGKDLLTLINDILDLSKIEAGKVELTFEGVEIARLVGDLRGRFEPLASEKGLELAVDVDPGCPETFETDGQRVRQVLTNLLSNAVKFTDEGRVRLHVGRRGSRQLAFAVEDSGIGIAAEHHESIFDAFRQADGTTNRRYGGTGLGLSICRELVGLLNGELELESAPGAGSVFTMIVPMRAEATGTHAALPVADSPLGARDVTRVRAPAPSTNGLVTKTVLLVEDDDRQREAATRFLGADGVNVVAVATAGDALAELRATSFDCVVVDLMLPGMSGFELLDEMSRDGHEAPAIVYTARPLDLDDEQRLRRHSRCIIVKGAHSPDRLREEVRRALEGEGPAPERPRVDGVARDREAVFVGRRVLLAEDDVRSVFALMSLLEAKGARVEVARNGNEALARVGREPPIDVVLMDVMMPVMDGLTAIREIRKNDGLAKLPIIALTAKAMPDDRQACLAAGANDYVMKPIDVERLLSLLRVWLPT